ncbi:MAG TPA: replication protein RepA [Roseomonas sp.]|nr:replication protein RepA [Roseomonas sp.]
MNSPVPQMAADSCHLQSDPSVVWCHPAFCQMALPVSAAAGSWRRGVGSVVVAVETATGDALPSGWCLRLLLMHLCDRAVRTASPLVEMGSDAAALAAELGLPVTEPVLREVVAQVERLLTARMTVSLDGHSALGVLDARGQSRRTGPAWRSRLRLNARFQASLVASAIPLDRRVVTALAAEPMALDAHGWIRQLRHDHAADTLATVAWDDLLQRFGSPGQDPASFRSAFEDALRMVFTADHSISLAADEAGVTVGFAAPENATAAPPASQEYDQPGEPAAAEARRKAKSSQHGPVSAPSEADARAAIRPHAAPERPQRSSGAISLGPHLTGLPGVVWLRRGKGAAPPVIGVTPGTRFEPERLTVLMLEPLIMQVIGGLPQKEFDAVSAWAMANRDLVDLVWEGRIGSFEEAAHRVRKAPVLSWRQS